MSAMSELYADIEEQLVLGAKPSEIAKHFNVSIKVVHEIQDDLQDIFSNVTNDENVYSTRY